MTIGQAVLSWIFIFLVVDASSPTSGQLQNKQNGITLHNKETEQGSTHNVIRRKRMFNILEGRLASEFLLKGAVRLFSTVQGIREFRKFGNARSALKDFYSLSPSNIRHVLLPNGGYAQTGEIGNRIILFKSRDHTGRPSIELVRKRSDIVEDSPTMDRIIYMDKPNF